MKKFFNLWLVVMLFSGVSCAKPVSNDDDVPHQPTTWATAKQMNERLGRGMNLGNTYEGDVSWGRNLDKSYLKIIAEQGFKHIRLPIRWNRTDRASATAPFTIQPAFFNEIKSVADAALQNKLQVIINVHHDDELNADPANNKERFLSYWRQISTYFKSYSDSLVFEVLNEPHDQLTSAVWNDLFAQALSVIRQANPKRCVLMGVADWGGVTAVDKIIIPADPYVILTVHYYNPFHFTHQGADWVNGSDPWLGTKWYDTQVERSTIDEDFKKVIRISKEKDIPVHVGEFGAFEKADMDSRVRWTRYLSRYFEQQGWSWAYWEFYSGFGIYDPAAKKLRMPLTNALVRDAMPAAFEPTVVNTLYTSNFSNAQRDGWNLYNNDASAASSLSITGGKINVSVTKPGDASWHLQLIRDGFGISNNKSYIVKFNAYSAAEKTITCSVSKGSGPWTSYSAPMPFTVTATDMQYSFIFHSNVDDANATMVFSIGNSGITSFVLYNISMQEITFQ